MNLSKMQVNAIVSVIQQKQRKAFDEEMKKAYAAIDKKKIAKDAAKIGAVLEQLNKQYPEIDKAEIINYRFNKKNSYSCSCEKNVTEFVYKELFNHAQKDIDDRLDESRESTSELERKVIIAAIDCENIAQLKKVFDIK